MITKYWCLICYPWLSTHLTLEGKYLNFSLTLESGAHSHRMRSDPLSKRIQKQKSWKKPKFSKQDSSNVDELKKGLSVVGQWLVDQQQIL